MLKSQLGKCLEIEEDNRRLEAMLDRQAGKLVDAGMQIREQEEEIQRLREEQTAEGRLKYRLRELEDAREENRKLEAELHITDLEMKRS